IADQSVRRHYLQAFDEKLAAFFAPLRQRRYEGRRDAGRGAPRERRTPRLVVSDSLRNSRRLKPGAVRDPSDREAVILMTLVNHPALAEGRLEALASLELPSPAARELLAALLDLVTVQHDIDGPALAAALGAR